MKTYRQLIITIGALFTAFLWPARAQLNIPGADGSDGAFTPLANTNIVDLSMAPNGVWNGPNTAPGMGVYDSNLWAVVFRYSDVNIPVNVMVKFKNHRSRAPVVWLVNGDATINGTVDLNGPNGGVSDVTEPAPGGFRGGAGNESNLTQGQGLGPGGRYNAAALYSYGNSQIVPLIGGSGGSGFTDSGAGGGGAILIAASGRLTINGQILARGGVGRDCENYSSGGAIRLIASEIAGNGRLDSSSSGCGAGSGRIRLEAPMLSPALRLNPPTIAVMPASPPQLWPPANAPTVRVLSIANAPVSLDPRAELGNNGGDITFTNAGTVQILIETTNLDQNASVKTSIKPKHGGPPNPITATFVSMNGNRASWLAQAPLPFGHFVVQVRAVSQ